MPTATDIAFALAVLAVISTHLPGALRTFLLTLAVVDDLLTIVIIAVFYTRHLDPLFLLLAVVPLGVFVLLVQRRIRSWWLLVPLAVLTWGLVHASGVHATVAGVLLAFTVPVLRSRSAGEDGVGPRAGRALRAPNPSDLGRGRCSHTHYGAGSERDEYVKVGVPTGALLAGLLAATILRTRNRTYRLLCEAEELDSGADGTPDLYETSTVEGAGR